MGGYAPTPRVSVEALTDYIRVTYEPDEYDVQTELGFTIGRIADLIGVAPASIHRWRKEGGIPLFSADRAACRLGIHPSLIWPDWIYLCDDSELELALA